MAFKNLFSRKIESDSELPSEANYASEASELHGNVILKKAQDDSRRTRNEVLKLRLTSEEKQLIFDRASEANMSMTDYIMAAVNSSPIVVIDKFPQVHVELLKQGSNLNQLLKIAHQTNARELSGVEEAVKQCSETHKKLIQFCERWDVKLRNLKTKKD